MPRGKNRSLPESKKAELRRILVTGSSGLIGRMLCPFLESRGFDVRGFDLKRSEIPRDFVQGSIEDLSVLRTAVRGMDAVVHLAACSDDADFRTRLFPANIIGVYNMLEAARLEHVGRLVLASTVQAVDWLNKSGPFKVEDRSPNTLYGVVKLCSEDLGRFYSTTYGLSVIAVRLGWILRDQRERELMNNTSNGKAAFLSHDDANEFLLRCLFVSQTGFSVLYALSRQPRNEVFDMKPSRELLGFEPKDSFS